MRTESALRLPRQFLLSGLDRLATSIQRVFQNQMEGCVLTVSGWFEKMRGRRTDVALNKDPDKGAKFGSGGANSEREHRSYYASR